MPMTPAERRAVARAVKIASGRQAFKKRRADLKAGKPRASGYDPGRDSLLVKAANNIIEDAINTPAGLVEVAKALGKDTAEYGSGKRSNPFSRTRRVGEQTAKGTVDLVRHPLRRPGSTLLLGLGAYGGTAGAVSRAGAAGSVLRSGGGVGRALTRPGYQGGSLLSRPTPGVRTLRVGDLEVRGRYSSSPGIRALQKGSDRIAKRYEGTTVGEARQIRKGGKELGLNRVVEDAARRGPALKLAKMGRKLTAPQQMALRVWAQGVSIDHKIAQHKQALTAAKGQSKRDLEYRITLLEAARPYMDGNKLASDFKTPRKVTGRPAASPKHLRRVAVQTDRVAGTKPGGRERILIEAGLLEPEQIEFRLHAPGRITLGAEWTNPAKDAADRLLQIDQARERIRGSVTDTVVPGGTVVTRRPRTRQDAEARLAEIDETLAPLLTDWTRNFNELRNEAVKGKGRIVKSRFEHQRDKLGWRKVMEGVSNEDLDVEGLLQEAPGAGKLRTGKKADDFAYEVLSQLAGRDARFDVLDLETMLDLHRDLTEQGVDFAALGRALDEREDLETRLAPDVEEAFGAAPSEPPRWYTDDLAVQKRRRDRIAELDALGTDPNDSAYMQVFSTAARDINPKKGQTVRNAVIEAADRFDARWREKNADDIAAIESTPAARERDFGELEERTELPGTTIPGRLPDEDVGFLAALDDMESQAFEDMVHEGVRLSGADDFNAGRVRVPDVPEVQPRSTPGRAAVYRGGQPRKPPSLRLPYTGALERSGGYRVKTSRLVAEAALEAHKYDSLLNLRSRVLQAGVDHRPPDTKLIQWVPVREKPLTAKARRQLQRTGRAAEHEVGLRMTPDERARAQASWERFVADVFPESDASIRGVGEKTAGVKWVPRQMLAGMNQPFARSGWAPGVAALDTVLNLVKLGIIPLKPAYITANAIGNALFNAFQQGVFIPRNWGQATRLLRDDRIGPPLRELMGSGGAQAILQGNPKGILGPAMHKYSNVLSEVMLEPMMRGSAFVHEARRFGHKTDAQMYRLMTDPKMRDDLSEITRRSKDAIIDYDRLGPNEKAIARRVLFIYPWVKGATLYAGHFLMEHPVQAGAYSAISQVGREEAQRELGDMPSWAKGSFKVGGTSDNPLMVNPTSISPLSQAAQIGASALGALTGEGGSAETLGGLLHPLIQSGGEAAFQRDFFTGAPLEGGFLENVTKRTLADTAPAVFMRNLEKAENPSETAAYPMTEKQAVARFTVGAFMPRTGNRKVLNERAAEEQNRGLSSTTRARRKVFKERQAVFAKIKAESPGTLVNGRLPAGIRKAYNREAAVAEARARAKKQARGSSLAYQRYALVAEARLAEKWGTVDKGFGRQAEEWAAVSRSPREIEQARDRLRYQAFRPAYQDVTSRARKFLSGE
jgi:hypothetical protein